MSKEQQHIDLVRDCLSKREIGDTFLLRELVGEKQWSQIGDPATFGKWFKKAVVEKKINDVEHAGTDPSKRRDTYKKIC